MLDVWFDLGVIYYFVVDCCDDILVFVDLYLEGLDQYCGWFMLLLMLLIVMYGYVFYKEVLIYGFMVDVYGRKMLKLVGNVVVFQEVINKLGVDIFCFWVVFIDYCGEIVVFDEIFKCVVDFYCCVCNMLCFLLVNLNGFKVEDVVVEEDMVVLD